MWHAGASEPCVQGQNGVAGMGGGGMHAALYQVPWPLLLHADPCPLWPYAVSFMPHAMRTGSHAVLTAPHAVLSRSHAVLTVPHAVLTRPHAVSGFHACGM